ncbi:MAG: lytic transglycosylase domain-containing protein [bacterium]
MFSESVSNLFGQSNIQSAQDRVSKIESMLTQYTSSIQKTASVNPKQDLPVQFSDYLKVKPQSELKFKLAAPPAIAKNDVENLVKSAAKKFNIDERLILAIIKQESNFNPNAVSSAGAKGLMQLMPGTASKLGVNNPFDPVQNIEGGVKYLKGLIDKYRGNLVLALSAYNAGSGNVSKYGGTPPFKETQNYVKQVLSNYLSQTPEGA